MKLKYLLILGALMGVANKVHAIDSRPYPYQGEIATEKLTLTNNTTSQWRLPTGQPRMITFQNVGASSMFLGSSTAAGVNGWRIAAATENAFASIITVPLMGNTTFFFFQYGALGDIRAIYIKAK